MKLLAFIVILSLSLAGINALQQINFELGSAVGIIALFLSFSLLPKKVK